MPLHPDFPPLSKSAQSSCLCPHPQCQMFTCRPGQAPPVAAAAPRRWHCTFVYIIKIIVALKLRPHRGSRNIGLWRISRDKRARTCTQDRTSRHTEYLLRVHVRFSYVTCGDALSNNMSPRGANKEGGGKLPRTLVLCSDHQVPQHAMPHVHDCKTANIEPLKRCGPDEPSPAHPGSSKFSQCPRTLHANTAEHAAPARCGRTFNAARIGGCGPTFSVRWRMHSYVGLSC
jgi:hypothetical protein